jgi:Spy/CpxP family protein refolding chaperone
MKNRFFILALASALSCGAGVLLAQDSAPAQEPEHGQQGGFHGARMNPDQQAAMLQKRLGLTDDQVSQIKPILADRQQQMQAIREDSSAAPADRMAKARSVMQDSNAKIKAILTEDQRVKYDQMEQQMRGRMRERMQERQNQNQSPNNR